jgi:hypothetical protein
MICEPIERGGRAIDPNPDHTAPLVAGRCASMRAGAEEADI